MMLNRGQFSCRRCRHAVGGHHRHCRHCGHASSPSSSSSSSSLSSSSSPSLSSFAAVPYQHHLSRFRRPTWLTIWSGRLSLQRQSRRRNCAPWWRSHQGGTEKRVATLLRSASSSMFVAWSCRPCASAVLENFWLNKVMRQWENKCIEALWCIEFFRMGWIFKVERPEQCPLVHLRNSKSNKWHGVFFSNAGLWTCFRF